MINNDVLRSVRYILKAKDAGIAEVAGLAGLEITPADVAAYLKKDGDEGYRECGDEVLAHVLDGLIVSRRGRDPSLPLRPIDLPVTNNLVMKKLRVAFELKDDDMHAILKAAGFPLAKPELSALFRKPGSKNYRACQDQVLRNFLKGLALRERGGPA